MRIASFNPESLDLPPKARVPLDVRAEVLRPVLQRLEADILCLQEVNARPADRTHARELFIALRYFLSRHPEVAHHPNP